MSDANNIENKTSSTAVLLMATHNILPTPENYTVWYHYAQGKNAEMNAEIDKVVAQKLPFTPMLCNSLYQRHFVVDRHQQMVDETSATAQKMLQDVLAAVNNFSGETKDYNKDLGQYITNITQETGDSGLKSIVSQIVGATASLKERGEVMNQRLEESKKEIEELRENLEQASHEAQRDGLTGLYNRRTFERIVEEYMGTALEKKTPLCLLMMDVDHFKKFNDTYGHLLGDEVLKIFARTLLDMLKGQDVVARFGGEEFVAVLPQTPIEGAMRVADAIRQTIASKELKRKDTGQNFGQITVSVGVASFRGATDDIPKLIQRADEALYESKRLGRNRVTRES